MHTSDFDYTLPKARIAQFPPEQRGSTRLEVINRESGAIELRHYLDLVDYLKAGDVVVLNNTKVIRARLLTLNTSGQQRELLLLEAHNNFNNKHKHQALYQGKLHVGETLMLHKHKLKIERVLPEGVVEISATSNLLDLIQRYGSVPLPPYMKRLPTSEDVERYQTVFARYPGSVAAPTASLNFTDSLRTRLEDKGVQVVYLTLHVGIGTFLPIRTNDLKKHTMHSEYFDVPTKTVSVIQQAKRSEHKIVAIGTTVMRTLEYNAERINHEQPKQLIGEADIFIYPGYKFKVADYLLTNFHAPRSTVLMLTAAFAGWDNLKQAYALALENKYDFLSYGDSMLII